MVFHGRIQLVYLLLLPGSRYLLASPLWKEDGFWPVLLSRSLLAVGLALILGLSVYSVRLK